MKISINSLFVVAYQSSPLAEKVMYNDEVHTDEADAQSECHQLNTELGAKRYSYMNLASFLQLRGITQTSNDPTQCPKCVGARVLGEIRGVRCSNCNGRGFVD